LLMGDHGPVKPKRVMAEVPKWITPGPTVVARATYFVTSIVMAAAVRLVPILLQKSLAAIGKR
jgi:hypothetical protein